MRKIMPGICKVFARCLFTHLIYPSEEEEERKRRKKSENGRKRGEEEEEERKWKEESKRTWRVKGAEIKMDKWRKGKENEGNKRGKKKRRKESEVERKNKGTEEGIVKDFHHKSVAAEKETLQGAGGLGPFQLSRPFRGSFNFMYFSRNSGPQTCQFSTTKSSVRNFRPTQLSLNLCPSSEILAEAKN